MSDVNKSLLSYKSVSKQLNDRVYSDYYYRLMLIARALFEWEGLPNGIQEKWIERYLYNEGRCLFFKDPMLGFMVTPFMEQGPLNYYNEPTTVRPYAVNWIYEGPPLMNGENCVIIRNNDDMLPTFPTIQLYAFKLTNIERTIDTNIMLQKMPNIIRCSDKQRLSLKNAINQRNDNEPVIYADKNLDLAEIEVLNTGAPYVADKLQLQKHNVWNETMTFLGINNANQDKKERLVEDEVSANNEQVQASGDVLLKARKRSCELLNEMFGLEVRVRRRIAQNPILDESEIYEDIEDGE